MARGDSDIDRAKRQPNNGLHAAAFAGRQLGSKIVLAFVVPSFIALLVLGGVARAYMLSSLQQDSRSGPIVVLGLVACTAVAMLAGGSIIRGAARAMLAATGQQAVEIASLASRLDAAHRELEATSARLKEFSFRDDVTGLYNRRFFGIRLEEEIARHRRFHHPVSVVMMDLDGFKAINDSLGHGVGDETLREVGQVLLKHSRGIDLVCRYGGDEYAVLLVETSQTGAQRYGDRIREVIGGYSFSHGRSLTASLGVATLPDDEASTSEDLVLAADEALYAAKRAGKNQVAMTASGERAT